MFSNGTVYEMDNYVNMTKYSSSKKKEIKLRQDKGFETEYQMIADVLKGKRKNETTEDALRAHRMLLEALA